MMGRFVAWVREDRWHGWRYRATARLLHRFNLHHTTSNLMDDGSTLVWCHWCGMRQRRVPYEQVAAQMRADLTSRGQTT